MKLTMQRIGTALGTATEQVVESEWHALRNEGRDGRPNHALRCAQGRATQRIVLLASLGIIGMLFSAGGARAAETVDLRGYGRVQASIAPWRSEFTCESAAKADILLGKLLADMFWDAGAERVDEDGGKSAAMTSWSTQWPPYGAVIAGRRANRVLVVGGKDAEDAATPGAGKEPLLTSADALFAPAKPYPKYLDFYDLGAVKCYTLDLHPENKFRYQDRAAFTRRFFDGGLHGFCMFDRGEPAEGVNYVPVAARYRRAAGREERPDVFLRRRHRRVSRRGCGTNGQTPSTGRARFTTSTRIRTWRLRPRRSA